MTATGVASQAAATALARAAEEVVANHWRPETTVGEWWAALADAGLAHPEWPMGLGGRGSGREEARAVTAVLARVGTVAPPSGGVAARLVAPTLLDHGSPRQQARYLPAVARGEEAWCQLFSEPDAGSDLASLSTRAEPDEVGGWVVTGQKVWTSGAELARRGLLLARTDPRAPRHAGITMFALDLEQTGVAVRPLRQMNGEARFSEVFLDRVRVEEPEVIGALGGGWTVARTTLRYERQGAGNRVAAGLVAVPSGRTAGYLDRPVGEVVAETLGRHPDRISGYAVPAKLLFELARATGRGSDPVTRDHLARYYTRTRLNRMTAERFRAAGSTSPRAEGPLLKLATSATCRESAELVFELLGAAGMLAGSDAPMDGSLHRSALGSPGARLGGGTDEIQHNVLAEQALGLPREP